MRFDEVLLERLARAALLVLYDGINTAIDAENTAFSGSDPTDDSAFWVAIGRTDPGAEAEHIASDNFYVGHVPSLIDAPVDRYPNIATMAYQADPRVSQDDWADQYMVHLAVEIMVRALCDSDKPDQAADARAAELVNMRCHRTLQAATKTLRTAQGRNFGGLVPKVGDTPAQIVTNVFVRHEEKGRGPRWFWQGARLDYRVHQWVVYGNNGNT